MLRRITAIEGLFTRNYARYGRFTNNPYENVTDAGKKYGKYAVYFDDKEDRLTKYGDKWDKHKCFVQLDYSYYTKYRPSLGMNTWVAPSATVAGNVELYYGGSIWYDCVVKADVRLIRIGGFATIQDGTVIHEALKPLGPDHDGSTIVGHYSTVGQSCNLRGCTIEESCIVGPHSVLQEGSYMERYSQLEPNTVLQKNQRVPTGQLWGGNPARFIRNLTDKERKEMLDFNDLSFKYSLVHKEEYYLHPAYDYDITYSE